VGGGTHDVVCLDVRMPVTDGEGCIKAIARGGMVLSPAAIPAVFDVLRARSGVLATRKSWASAP
jgi:hypothetical protein